MSQENVEIVRAIYKEAAEGRLLTYRHLLHPEVEYIRTASGGEEDIGLSGTWRGPDAMMKAASEWARTFELLRFEAERIIDVGDSVVVFTRHTGKAKISGLPIDAEFADVLTLRDGLIVRVAQYRHRSEALEAVGLRD